MSQSATTDQPDFAAFIAIDWADREHAWALQVAGSTQREQGKFQHTPEAIEVWALEWAARFEGRPVAVALEQARGALVYALGKYPHLVLFPIHPSTSSTYRKAMFPSGSKDDPKDADLLLDLLTLHRHRLRALQPDTEPTRSLQNLVEQRRQLVDQRTAETNRIRQRLKLYFPQVLDWFDDLDAPIVAAFLKRWPTLPQLQNEDAEHVRQFFFQHGSRSEPRIQARLEQIPQARALLADAAVIQPAVMLVSVLLEIVAALNRGIQQLEHAIQQQATAHPDHFIFASFPAAGPALTPRLLAAFGSQRERYRSAEELQSFSGIAPITSASGSQKWIHFRWACPKFLRQTFHEYAGLSIQRCAWAREFYDRQRAKQKSHHAAVRSLAFKWIRILFRCWQSRQPYREELYLAVRERRAVPLKGAPPRQPSVPTPRPVRGNPQDRQLKKAGDVLKSLLAGA